MLQVNGGEDVATLSVLCPESKVGCWRYTYSSERGLAHALANATHGALPERRSLDPSDCDTSVDALLQMLAQSQSLDRCVTVSTGVQRTYKARALEGGRRRFVESHADDHPDYAGMIGTAAVLMLPGKDFVAIVNMHSVFYRHFPVALAKSCGAVLADVSGHTDLCKCVMAEHVEAWANQGKASTIFRVAGTADPYRLQLPAKYATEFGALVSPIVRQLYGELPSLAGWAPPSADDAQPVHIQNLLRLARGAAYNPLGHQGAHQDCPDFGMGPSQQSITDWPVGSPGVMVDSIIITGAQSSKIWIKDRSTMKLLVLPPFHVLLFKGSQSHAGADFEYKNAVTHAYVGGSAVLDALQTYSEADLFDTTDYHNEDADVGAFRSWPGAKRLQSGQGGGDGKKLRS